MNTEALYELIRSMSADEKRLFRLDASRYGSDRGHKYLDLFRLLDSMPRYDEKKFAQRIRRGKFPVQLHVTCAYLADQLLAILVRKSEKEDFSLGFQKRLAQADLLFEKGLHRHALKRVRKLADEAEAAEKPLLSLQTGQLLEKIVFRINDPDLFGRFMQTEMDRLFRALHQHETYLQTRRQALQLIYFMSRHSPATLLPSQKKELETIASALRKKLPAYATAETTILRLGALTLLGRFHGSTPSALKYATEALERALEAGVEKLSGGIGSLLNLHNNLSMLLSASGSDMKKLEPYTRRVLAYPVRNRNDKVMVEERILTAMITQNNAFGRFRLTESRIPAIEKFLGENTEAISHFGKTMLPYNVLYHYFSLGKYRPALKWLNMLVNYDFSQMPKNIIENILVLELLLHFELGNEDLLVSRIRSNEKAMRRHNTYSALEATLLRTLRPALTADRSQRIKLFNRLHEQLTELKKNPSVAQRFSDFAYDKWAKSQLTGQPIAELN